MRFALICTILATLSACQSGSGSNPPNDSVSSPKDVPAGTSSPPNYGETPNKHARADVEIALHAELYRAAYEGNVGDFTRHFLLEPVQESDPPDIATDPAEFRRRVLDSLSDLNVPMAWVNDTWRTGGVDYFPGTEERATRLRIKILSRDEDAATVQGEVGDTTADVGSSRQRVTATWDGQHWRIERGRARLVW